MKSIMDIINTETRGGIESVVVEDGVEMTTYRDGSMTFRAVNENGSSERNCREEDAENRRKPKRRRIRPYAKIRNLSDPFGKEQQDGGKRGYEIGIRFEF